jgi:hypothetical protein
VVVSIFGEFSTDKRDFRMGLAGLLAGVQSLRILAERGIASPEDIRVSRKGIDQVLDTIPEGELPEQQRSQIAEMLMKIEAAAAMNFGKKQ